MKPVIIKMSGYMTVFPVILNTNSRTSYALFPKPFMIKTMDGSLLLDPRKGIQPLPELYCPLFHLKGYCDFVSDCPVDFYGGINLNGGNVIIGGGDKARTDVHLPTVIKGLAHAPALGIVEFPIAADSGAVGITEDEGIQVGNVQFRKVVTLELADIFSQSGGAGGSHIGSNRLEIQAIVNLREGVARTNVVHFNLHGRGGPVASHGSELRQSFGRGDAGSLAIGCSIVGVICVEHILFERQRSDVREIVSIASSVVVPDDIGNGCRVLQTDNDALERNLEVLVDARVAISGHFRNVSAVSVQFDAGHRALHVIGSSQVDFCVFDRINERIIGGSIKLVASNEGHGRNGGDGEEDVCFHDFWFLLV